MIDAEKHHRRSIRFAGYDYAAGAYFVTLCAKNKRSVFGRIREGGMQTNIYGDFVRQCWLAVPEHFAHAALDEWIIMPNHFHGILILRDPPHVGARHASPKTHQPPQTDAAAKTDENRDVRARHASPLQRGACGTSAGSLGALGALIGAFKSAVTRQTNIDRQQQGLSPVQVWQRNYYERIIRDQSELDATRRYIIENPQRWATDENNPHHTNTP